MENSNFLFRTIILSDIKYERSQLCCVINREGEEFKCLDDDFKGWESDTSNKSGNIRIHWSIVLMLDELLEAITKSGPKGHSFETKWRTYEEKLKNMLPKELKDLQLYFHSESEMPSFTQSYVYDLWSWVSKFVLRCYKLKKLEIWRAPRVLKTVELEPNATLESIECLVWKAGLFTVILSTKGPDIKILVHESKHLELVRVYRLATILPRQVTIGYIDDNNSVLFVQSTISEKHSEVESDLFRFLGCCGYPII
jgi:hypothetical protein